MSVYLYHYNSLSFKIGGRYAYRSRDSTFPNYIDHNNQPGHLYHTASILIRTAPVFVVSRLVDDLAELTLLLCQIHHPHRILLGSDSSAHV